MFRSLLVAAALCVLGTPFSAGAAENATALKVAGTGTPGPSCACNYTLSTLYFAFHPKVYDRVYTTSYDELLSLVRAGWERVPDAGLVLLEQAPGSIPLYRFWNSGLADHIYTISTVERDNLMLTSGWVFEGIAAYVLPRAACGTLPFYRVYNAQYHAHYYMTDPAIMVENVWKYGFVFQSVAGYIWANDGYQG